MHRFEQAITRCTVPAHAFFNLSASASSEVALSLGINTCQIVVVVHTVHVDSTYVLGASFTHVTCGGIGSRCSEQGPAILTSPLIDCVTRMRSSAGLFLQRCRVHLNTPGQPFQVPVHARHTMTMAPAPRGYHSPLVSMTTFSFYLHLPSFSSVCRSW
jgi:hypothetical protein